MFSARKTSWITWAILFAQTFVLVLGHGRIVVCHDEGGTSHIEIVDEDSCSILVPDGCRQTADSSDESRQVSPLCSDSSCFDEPLGIPATLSGVRIANGGEQQGVLPPPSLAVVDWLVLQDPMERQIDFDDAHAIAGFHRSIGSVILLL
jgi:hypothetical protein